MEGATTLHRPAPTTLEGVMETENKIRANIFNYNGEDNSLRCESYEGGYIGLKGGVWKKPIYIYPMSTANIDILFKLYKHDSEDRWGVKNLWQPSLVYELQRLYKDKFDMAGNLRFLHSLTLDSVKRYPTPFKLAGNDLEPFANQMVSQYWQKYVKEHALLWEMGTGKTRSIVEAFEIKKKDEKVKNCLVLCPLSMVDKWIVEIEKWSGCKDAVGLCGSRADKVEALSLGFTWVVATFETAYRLEKELLSIVNTKWMVVLDEFTKIKNPYAKRSKTCVKLGLKTKHKNILSGTPITQNAYDIFTPFMFLDNGETFGLNYEDFLRKYFWTNGYKKIAMSGSLQRISDLIFDKSTRFRKKECIDIPDKIYDTIPIELPPENKQKYDEMVQYAIAQLMSGEIVTAPIILVQLLRLSQITSGFAVDEVGQTIDFVKQPKLDAFQDILDGSNGTKIIAWSRFKHDIDRIAERCNESGVRAVKLYGDTKQEERTANIKAFQEEPDCKVIVGTAGTGGHGIDLVAGNIVVYYSNSYSLEQRLQSEDRTHRAGQRNQVQYIDLLCKKTVDIAIYKILREKKSIADVVTRDNVFGMLTNN